MCASKMLRRSGVAVGLHCDLLKWRADTIIQVGVGVEHQEINVLKEEWPGVKVIGFEAHPDVFRAAQAEGLYDDIFWMAVSNEEGYATLYGKPKHKSGSALFPIGEDCAEYQVPMNSLDEFLEADQYYFKRTLLWLDCEGNEYKVLLGAKETCAHVEVVNVEMTSNPLSDQWCKPEDVHRLLRDYGFQRQWVHSENVWSGQFDAIYVKPNLFQLKYCCDRF